jgi:hypothetical protein
LRHRGEQDLSVGYGLGRRVLQRQAVFRHRGEQEPPVSSELGRRILQRVTTSRRRDERDLPVNSELGRHIAEPLFATAASANSLSARSSADAYSSAEPLFATAAKTISLSALNSAATSCVAAPSLSSLRRAYGFFQRPEGPRPCFVQCLEIRPSRRRVARTQCEKHERNMSTSKRSISAVFLSRRLHERAQSRQMFLCSGALSALFQTLSNSELANRKTRRIL